MKKNQKNLNIQELQEDLLTNSDIHIVEEEYLILLKRIKTISDREIFWASGACFFVRSKTFKRFGWF